MLNELVLDYSLEGGLESHKFYQQNELMLKAEISQFPTLNSFVDDFLIPRIIVDEYEYLWDSAMDELKELMDQTPLTKWLAFSNSELETIEECLEDDEIGLMSQYLRLKNDLLQQTTELKGIEISHIVAQVKGKGVGTELVNQYKAEYDYIILYPEVEARSYWEKQDFKDWNGSYQIWAKNQEIFHLIECW